MSPQPHEQDPFLAIVAGLDDKYDIDTSGEYVVVSLADDMRKLRERFSAHVKTCLKAEPGVELRPEDFGYIEGVLNEVNVSRLSELSIGDTVVVGEGAFTVYQTETGLACENVVEGECVVGQFHRVVVVPVPTLETMMQTRVGIDEMAYEVALVLTRPTLEIDRSEPYAIPSDYIVVTISDPEVEFLKRLMPGNA